MTQQEKICDRRGLFKEALRLVGKNVASYLDSKVEEIDKIQKIQAPNHQPPEYKSKRRDYLRPPGAFDEALFLDLCKGCKACVSACPRRAIKLAGSDYPEISGTPIIIPRESPCVLCRDLSCAKACKKGVLLQVKNSNDVKMGLAEINSRNCPAWSGGSNCQLCYIKCPLFDSAIYLDDQRPVVNPDVCTGCGVCEHACSTVNSTPAIRVRPVIRTMPVRSKVTVSEFNKQIT